MSNVAGLFSGVLMTASLVAVPCLAVFGIPSAGQAVVDPAAPAAVALGPQEVLGVAAPDAKPDALAFAPLVDAAGATDVAPPASASAQAHLDRTSDRRGAAANRAVEVSDDLRVPADGPARSAPDVPSARPRDFAQAPAAPEGNVFLTRDQIDRTEAPPVSLATWEEAIARLNSLGIDDFHLTNGEIAGEFYFSCSLRDEARKLTRRFEAEGGSPVAAAEDVLAQVEECIGTP